MKVECVLFDLDGVLVNACEWHYDALNCALRDVCDMEILRHDHETKYNGLPTKIKLKMLGIDSSLIGEISRLKQNYTMEIIQRNAKVMDEKRDLHQYLKRHGIKVACVTNSIRMTAMEMLVRTGQMEYMDILVTNEDVENNKPSPDCYNYAIEKLGVDPSACICVEDSPKGLQAAINSRSKNVWSVANSSEVTLESYRRFIYENTNSNGR